jgi:Pao retrotransposon peptidase
MIQSCEQWVRGIKEVAAKCTIPRWYGIPHNAEVWLHAFGDASEKAYGAVVYLAYGDKVMLGAAKARVAPVKPQTIPRLELEGAKLAFRLVDFFIKETQQLQITRVTVWLDSMAVLGWIGQPAKVYPTFIANRLGEIHEKLDSEAFQQRRVEVQYVPSGDNPADLVSRGCSAMELAHGW